MEKENLLMFLMHSKFNSIEELNKQAGVDTYSPKSEDTSKEETTEEMENM